jgi:serine/threonine protein phosphatase PrpC
MAVDHMRRRLTVSHCDTARPGVSDSEDKEIEIERAGLKQLFAEAQSTESKAACICSITDAELTGKQSFCEKSTLCISSSPGTEAENKQWIAEQGIGWSCRKGMKPESPNQDSFSVVLAVSKFALYSVFDGHGPSGHFVSDFVRKNVVQLFLGNPLRNEDPGTAFTEAFRTSQEMLEEMQEKRSSSDSMEHLIDASMSGTTCTMAYHNLETDVLTIAHVGDSRAVLGRRNSKADVQAAEELTQDHKPNLPGEKQRIENSNPPGRVVFDGFYNYRVFAQGGPYPGLNMSRAIGDVTGHKEAGLSAVPDVKVVNLKEERDSCEALMLVLCTDGVWEFIENEEAVEEIHKFKPTETEAAIQTLAKIGWDRWMKDSDNEISDDITGLLVDLSTPPSTSAPS